MHEAIRLGRARPLVELGVAHQFQAVGAGLGDDVRARSRYGFAALVLRAGARRGPGRLTGSASLKGSSGSGHTRWNVTASASATIDPERSHVEGSPMQAFAPSIVLNRASAASPLL